MKIFFAISLLLISSVTHALGRVVSYEEAKSSLFGSIEHLTKCGQWRKKEQSGEFRVFQLYYGGQDMLFVDMVAINLEQTQYNTVVGFSFSEINNDHAEIELDGLSCKQVKINTVKVQASATNGHDGSEFSFEILINGDDGTYTYIQQPSNK